MYAALSGLYSCTFVQCSLYAHCTHPSATYIILVYKSKTSVHIRKVHHSNCDSLYIFHGLHELSSENGEYCACVCNVYTFANHWQKAKQQQQQAKNTEFHQNNKMVKRHLLVRFLDKIQKKKMQKIGDEHRIVTRTRVVPPVLLAFRTLNMKFCKENSDKPNSSGRDSFRDPYEFNPHYPTLFNPEDLQTSIEYSSLICPFRQIRKWSVVRHQHRRIFSAFFSLQYFAPVPLVLQ